MENPKIYDLASLQRAKRNLAVECKKSEEELNVKLIYLKEHTFSVLWKQISPLGANTNDNIAGVAGFAKTHLLDSFLGIRSGNHHGGAKHSMTANIMAKVVDAVLAKYTFQGAGKLLGMAIGAFTGNKKSS